MELKDASLELAFMLGEVVDTIPDCEDNKWYIFKTVFKKIDGAVYVAHVDLRDGSDWVLAKPQDVLSPTGFSLDFWNRIGAPLLKIKDGVKSMIKRGTE